MGRKPKMLIDWNIHLLCKCGCGQKIIIKKFHSNTGYPSYISGHNPHPSDSLEKELKDMEKTINHKIKYKEDINFLIVITNKTNESDTWEIEK